MNTEWCLKSFIQLTGEEVYEILKIRSVIFVVEQNCAYLDMDDKDKVASHLFKLNQQSEIICYCRILPPNTNFEQASIGRVVTNKNYRAKGLAREMMVQAIRYIEEEWRQTEIKISAQKYLEHFYGTLGFQSCSKTYLEDNIPHIEMIRKSLN